LILNAERCQEREAILRLAEFTSIVFAFLLLATLSQARNNPRKRLPETKNLSPAAFLPIPIIPYLRTTKNNKP
jgi:hypothetical protein